MLFRYRVRHWLHERLYDLGMFIVRLALRLDPRDTSFEWLSEDEGGGTSMT